MGITRNFPSLCPHIKDVIPLCCAYKIVPKPNTYDIDTISSWIQGQLFNEPSRPGIS